MRATAEHRPATRKRRFAHDELTAVDLFSGFGGLTKGLESAGFSAISCANHSKFKIEVHEANHPNAEHWIADLVDTESAAYHSVRDLPAADLLAAGVSCVNHSQANTKKAYEQGLSLFDLEDSDFDASVTRSEKDRATANCVLHYAAHHHPRLILIECTTELTSWGPAIAGKRKVGDGSTYRWWLKQFDLLGYKHRVLYLNSMFFGVPQSRDRLYIAYLDTSRADVPDVTRRSRGARSVAHRRFYEESEPEVEMAESGDGEQHRVLVVVLVGLFLHECGEVFPFAREVDDISVLEGEDQFFGFDVVVAVGEVRWAVPGCGFTADDGFQELVHQLPACRNPLLKSGVGAFAFGSGDVFEGLEQSAFHLVERCVFVAAVELPEGQSGGGECLVAGVVEFDGGYVAVVEESQAAIGIDRGVGGEAAAHFDEAATDQAVLVGKCGQTWKFGGVGEVESVGKFLPAMSESLSACLAGVLDQGGSNASG